jgi:hypothetical protein
MGLYKEKPQKHGSRPPKGDTMGD